MTLTRHATPQLADDLVVDVPDEATVAGPIEHGSRLSVNLDRPSQTTVVVEIAGEVDASSVSRLQELLHHRLSSCTRTVVVDMSSVTFFDSAGVELLCACQHHAHIRSVSLRLATGGTGRVDRLIDLLGIGGYFSRYGSVADALTH